MAGMTTKQLMALLAAGALTPSLAGKVRDTPITRVVNLLKEMQATIDKEQSEDEALRDKLKCWCNDNNWEKGNAEEASENKISELESTIESLTARSAELSESIKELEAQVASDKTALAEATATRNKQLEEFHGMEMDSIQAVENLKAALTVLSKHHDGTPAPWGQGGADSFGQPSDSWSFLAVSRKTKDEPWTQAHEDQHVSHSLDEFMRRNGFDANGASMKTSGSAQGFLQADTAAASATWTSEETAVVRKAMKSVQAFVQAHQGEQSMGMPSYNAQSGEIVGVMKQLKEEMEGDLAESQKLESERAATFEELRAAKTAEIENGEKMAEQKEDELATTDNNLAEAKEDLEQEKVALAETKKFLANLKETCAKADENYEARKAARAEETKAVAETISILTADEARDNFSETYSLMQISAAEKAKATSTRKRKQAAAMLRRSAAKSNDPRLVMLATTVELDAFTKVKKAIDDMISMLKVQQEDEVKKADWCKESLQTNEMTTAKTDDHKKDLEAAEAQLASDIEALAKRIAEAKTEVAELQVDLQRANEDRQLENKEFQKSVADQTMTVAILKKALDKLANYYDLLQTKAQGEQTPPVPQMEYGKSQGSEGVMQMIEKLIGEAETMTKDAKAAENDAQAAYESIVADTNGSVAALSKEIATKTKNKAEAEKDKMQTAADIVDTVKELEGLAKENGELHTECDYTLKNFDVRQTGRQQEIESLQQAKQILSGASLS